MGFKSLFSRKKKLSSTTTTSSSSPSGDASGVEAATPPTAEIGELEQVFKKFDVNGDGKISASELGSIMGSLGHVATEEELKSMIVEVDADGDGFIDFGEFVELNTKGIDAAEAMRNLKDAFEVYDIDGNGEISAEELFEVLKSLGDECSIDECRKMIGGVDSNGDGMINFDEFKVMMRMGPPNAN